MVIMVRTRGLGHALVRVIGRGRHDEHDAIDVPQRRRPTASASRRRVHITIDEGVPQVTEDVPYMAEDVPQMIADVDATIVEDLGRDGAKGSHADEGFPGGPRDPSVPTSFAEHVAHAIWTRQERPKLKLVSHGRKVALIGRPVPAIEGLVVTTGLSPLIECTVVIGNPGLISVFVERWHRETSTFHLLVGELTITLDDVSSLLHLPISGAFHSFEAISVDETVFLLMELLEVSGEEARAESIRARRAYVHLSWVQEIYEMRCQARRWIVAARAYLLHLVECNKCSCGTSRGFSRPGSKWGYAWGAATLIHMYDQLDEASRTTTRQIGGYLTLLQCWIYEHFPSVHQCVTDDAYEETFPRASRWLTMKAHMKGIIGALYRAHCDALTVTDVCWLPYSDHRGVRGFELISSFQGQLKWGPTAVTIQPERSIPSLPVSASLSYDDIDDRWMHFLDHVVAVGYLCVVSGQASDQPRQAPAPDHEDYMQPDIPQVPVAFDPPRYAVDDYKGCEAIAKRLERVLNLRMVTVGTELHDVMQDCLRIAKGLPAQMEVLGLDKDDAQSIDDVFYVL
ncbi:Protein MAIN-LIKE 2 [Glycine soja]